MALEMGPYLPAGRARIAEGSEVFDAVVKYNAEQAERLLRGRRKTISGTR